MITFLKATKIICSLFIYGNILNPEEAIPNKN